MALYDNYFTNEDKPFAENLNDALLISNVFDFTVPIVLPTMFSNNTWVDTTSPRKCGVAIATLKEALPSGISVGTSGGNSTLTGTGTVKLLFYPNFNTFGKFKAINWESSNNKIQVNLKKKNGTSIASNISKGNLSVNITDLEELLIEIVFTASDTLTSFTITMENKDSSNRYGADVKIQSVDGLETRLTNIESKNTSQDTAINGKVDKVTNKGLSTNDFTTAYKNKIDGLSTVATSGSYSDLSNKPSIPTKTSQLTNDGDGTNVFVKNNDSRLTNSRTPTSHTHGNISNVGAIGSASGKIITTTTSGVLTASDSITKNKISDFPTSMTPTSHTHGNLTNAGAIGSSSGQIITTTTNGVLTASSTITKSKISDFPTSMTPTSHTHGSVTNDGKIGSASGKLIVTENNGVLSAVDTITKSKISDFSHTHGNISNDGKIGSTANKPLITTTNGQITTGMFGTTAGTFAEGNHSHNSWQEVTLSNQYASLYVNTDLRLAEFKYYQQNVSFTSTSDKTIASEIIPTEYRPVVEGVPVTLFNPRLGGNIDSATGNFNVSTTETGNKIVNAYGIWRF